MLWLYLLGLVTFLTIVVRRLLRRQRPLIDDVYAKRLAIDHVHDGVAFANGEQITYTNPAMAALLDSAPEQISGRPWRSIFTPEEQDRVDGAYRQMLLSGKARVDTYVVDACGKVKPCHLLIVAVHDRRARLVGHHCILRDTSRAAAPRERMTVYAGRG